MFSGIVETLGEIRARAEGYIEIAPSSHFADLGIGESVAVNGACLTVAAVTNAGFRADVMPETFQRTTLGGLATGSPVNLERALRFGDRVGGHMVSGHVDATGIVSALRQDVNARWATIALEADLAELIAEKGCVAVDGISLTVVDVFESAFTVSLIPHTLLNTTAGLWKVGSLVNLEIDLIARYVARSLESRGHAPAFLATAGEVR
jgi:riboflavin synthase